MKKAKYEASVVGGNDDPSELHQARGFGRGDNDSLDGSAGRHDDVQNVHSNFDIDQKLLEEVAANCISS